MSKCGLSVGAHFLTNIEWNFLDLRRYVSPAEVNKANCIFLDGEEGESNKLPKKTPHKGGEKNSSCDGKSDGQFQFQITKKMK